MTAYVGRFAPSPTGALHAGSLVAALASHCDALLHAGEWLLRIEDIDPPREVPGAAHRIIDALAALGFRWSREVGFQSARDTAYRDAFARLEGMGLVYPCACTRAEVAAATIRRTLDGELIYPGTCARGLAPGREARAWRLRMPASDIAFSDRWAGPQSENPARDAGDIVILRADGRWAYQLAVVVDDIAAGVTDVVRGDDLLHSSARQIAIGCALGARAPRYLHVPVLRNARGEKLSKQTHAPAVDPTRPVEALLHAARHLGMALDDAPTVRDFWRRAPTAWQQILNARARSTPP